MRKRYRWEHAMRDLTLMFNKSSGLWPMAMVDFPTFMLLYDKAGATKVSLGHKIGHL